jgi:hypothetical protein
VIDFEYLSKGICGLARAHQANAMAGHLGAAVIAGYFFGEDHHDLDMKVHSAIQKELDRILGGEESLWFDQKKAGITIVQLFEPLPKERPQQKRIGAIADALAGNIGKTRQSGHNVIFASIAIRALSDHPDLATPAAVDGIRKLIEGFNGAVPGRGYYGKQRGWITGDQVALPKAAEAASYRSQQAMAELVIDQLMQFASEHRRGFGGLFHLINHAAGITELSRFGYKTLAEKGFEAHRHHVRLWRSRSNLEQELGTLQRAEQDPRTPEYWSEPKPTQWSARLTHRIKTLYGFFTLLEFIEDAAKRKKAEQSFLYLMA